MASHTVGLNHPFRVPTGAVEVLILSKVAAAAGASVRVLRHVFRRHCGIAPMGCLRRVSLAGAHRAVRAADAVEDTVAAIAAPWGFATPDRFAAVYCQAYGTCRSHTPRTSNHS